MKYLAILMFLLVACATGTQEMGKPTTPVTQQTEEEIAKATPLPSPPPTPTVEQNPPPTETSTMTPTEQCVSTCEDTCKNDAAMACRETERSTCKAKCGDIIDPSACTEVCSYVMQQPQACKTQFEKFCSTQCPARCN